MTLRALLSFTALLLTPAAAVDSVVVFNEISYHPADTDPAGEWIELHNQMAIDIDLSAWQIEDGINITFPEGTIIPGGGYLLVAANPAALQSGSGLSGVKGPFTGSLNNDGERLELRDRNGRLMDKMVFADGGKWPLAPDGSGATLAKRDPDTISDAPENWTSSVVTGGTPGARNFPVTSATVQSLISMDAIWRHEVTGTDLGAAWKEPAYNDTAWPGVNSASLVGYWPLNGNAVATMGTNGDLTGAPAAAADRAGTAGAALAFNGSTQYVSVPGGGGLNGAASGTIALWARWNSAFQDADCCGTYGAITARQSNGLFSDNILALNAANPATAKLVWKQTGATSTLITSSLTVGTAWRHIAITFSPGGSTLYINGVAQGTATGSPLNNNAATPLSLGAWAGDGAGFMNGTLDDVAVWNAPLSAAQIAELAASTKTPMDFSGAENAVYFSGDGTLATNDELRRKQVPTGAATYYFRRAFTFPDNPARASLKLDLAVDDGAVVYLNGTEIHRHNMPAGVVSYSTPAASVVGAAPLLTSITVPPGALVNGTNVLAVEVHQAETPDPGMVFGAALTATITPPGLEAVLPDSLVFNEVSAADGGPLQVELMNRGAAALDLAGYTVRRMGVSPDAAFVLPSLPLTAGGFHVLTEAILGFGAGPGDRLVLMRPGGAVVADAVEVKARARGRSPDGTGEFLVPSAATFGSANVFSIPADIVISEIMYSAPPTLEQPASGGNPAVPYAKNPEQWIELHNKSSAPVNLTGWRVDEGIDFPFPAGTIIPGGGYLVVAKDPAALLAKFPGISVLGPFSNSLSGSGERIVLRDANDNPADSVRYSDDGRWPEAADGGGSSLELRDPRADNNAGANWAASDESGRSTWQIYTYEGVAAASAVGPDTQWNEFVLGLLDKGEVLLDDITVTESPAGTPVAMLQNSAFTTDASKWRIIGNHKGTVINDPDQPGNKVLRLVATGSTDHMSNHAETTFASSRSVVNGRTYRISFRAKWISGCRQLNTRLYFNRLAKTTVLAGRDRIGTPGSANTAAAANIGPTYSGLLHQPAVPAALATVTVSVSAADPDNVAAMTLWSRVESGAWTSQPMAQDPAAPQRYSAVLPGRAAGTIVQFYVEGTDGLGVKSTFPAAGAASRALYKVNDGLSKTNGLHNVRLVALTAEADFMHATVNLMSNQRTGATVIYNEREIFYDVGLRLKGSEHSRTETLRLGFNVGFNSEQLFRGVHRSIAIDRSESVGYGQREMLMHVVENHCGGVPTRYHDLIQVIAPRLAHTGGGELQLGRYTDIFLDDQYENGSDGMMYEYEVVYQLNSTDNGTAEGNKLPAPDSVVGIGITNMGTDKERYRWTYLVKNNEDRDDFSRIMPWATWMATTGTTFTSGISTYIDPDQWLRATAINVLSGAGDSYAGDGSQHNVQFYVRPSDGKVLLFPHDMDAFHDSARSIYPNGELNKIIEVPAHARTYFCHLLDIMATTHNAGYLGRWATQFGNMLPAQPFASHLAFVTSRNTTVTNAINAAVPPGTAFAITTNGGNNTSTGNSTITLTGTANLTVKTIRVNGIAYPITWTSRTAWSITVPLAAGSNALSVQGVDRSANPLAAAVDTITVTNTGTAAPLPVRINEWMASNAGPDGASDPADSLFQDWFELYNPNVAPVDLSGYTVTDDFTVPGKWAIPAGTSIPGNGFLVIWADNEVLQNTPGNGLHAAFQLGAGGESLGLYNAAGVAQHTLTFGAQTQNVSEGLFPDGDVNSIRSMPNWTPRWPNTLIAPMRITGVTKTGAGTALEWTAIPGRTYRIEWSTDLAAPWTAIAPDIPATGETASGLDPSPLPQRRFYRIRRLE